MQWIAFFLVFLLYSCSKTQYNVRVKAPINENFAGIITKCVPRADIEKAITNEGLSYRVLSEKDNLFEIYGSNENDLKELFANINKKAKFVKNKFIRSRTKVDDLNVSQFMYGPWSLSDLYDDFHHLKQINKDMIPKKFNGKGVTIAILDTGIAMAHVDLSGQIKVNDKEVSKNGKDDDQNGYIDDYQGWDFVNWDNSPQDDHGHGTHVAGIAAGKIAGVAPGAKILPVKVMNADGSGDIGTIVAGIRYSIDQGANIINLSLGSTFIIPHELIQLINEVTRAADKDVLFVAASGNGGGDQVGDCNEDEHHYPSDIENENVISVASINEFDELSTFSNYGPVSVDLAAPGDSVDGGILSTSFGNGIEFDAYERMRGTSMATPIVAGAAAILKQHGQNLKVNELIQLILENVDKTDELMPLLKSGGKLNLSKAFFNQD
ncbi:MAG: S8 family serine peptidase [Halobacteriovoraceae bacterium]|nr:S8 family serine peptidase [Halobacteriovoraceae bacterium]